MDNKSLEAYQKDYNDYSLYEERNELSLDLWLEK